MFLSAGDKLMPEMHLTQPGITYSACRPFAKNKEKKYTEIQRNRRFTIYLSKGLYKLAFNMA